MQRRGRTQEGARNGHRAEAGRVSECNGRWSGHMRLAGEGAGAREWTERWEILNQAKVSPQFRNKGLRPCSIEEGRGDGRGGPSAAVQLGKDL